MSELDQGQRAENGEPTLNRSNHMTLREGDHMRLQIDPALSKGNLIKKYFF